MKRIYKLLAIFIAIFAFSTLVKAQTWDAPAMTGSVLTTGTSYYVYNVGSNGYLTRGGWWGTHAAVSAQPRPNASTSVVKYTATNTAGSEWTFQYNLNGANVTNNFLFVPNGNTDGSIFTDNTLNSTWNVVQTDALNNIYSIQLLSSFGAYVADQYVGTSVATETTNRGIANAVRYNRASGDSYTQWKFATQDDIDLYNAKVLLDKYMTLGKSKGLDVTSYVTTYNAGVTADINTAAADLLTALGRTDVSSLITNKSFEDATFPNGWTNVSFAKATNVPGQGWTRDGAAYAEKWTNSTTTTVGYLSANSITQTVNGLTSGLYELVVSAHAVQQVGGNPLRTGAYITAGSQTTEVVAGQDYSISNIVVAGSTLTIGYALVAPIACNWTGFDNFKLYYYGPAAVPVITPSKTQFSFSGGDGYVKDSLTVSGLNLSGEITISAPAGITVNPTSLPSDATDAKVIVTYDNATTVSGNITFTSGSTSVNVAVTGLPGANCYTPLYSSGNMIADPKFSAATLAAGGYGGWGIGGAPGITTTDAYCGVGSAWIRGTCWQSGGSIDRTLNTANGNALKPNTLYRLRAMVNSKASPGTFFHFQVEGYDGAASITFALPNTNGWVQFDTTFITGATVTNSNRGIYFNSCTSATPALLDTCYLDNYELFEIPTTINAPLNDEDNGRMLFTSVGQSIDVPVTATGFTKGLTVTSNSDKFVVQTPEIPAEGGTVTVRFVGTTVGLFEGTLTIAMQNQPAPAPGMNKVSGTGILLAIPMAADITTGISGVSNDGSKVFTAGNDIIAQFNLSKSSTVDMSVYNVNGMLVANQKSQLNAGANEMILNANIPSGVYFVKINIDSNVTTTKLVK